MAFNLKYYAEGKNRRLQEGRLEIYARDYLGEPIPLELVERMFVAAPEWEGPGGVYVPHQPVSGTAYLKDDLGLVMQDLLTIPEGDLYMRFALKDVFGNWKTEWMMTVLANSAEQTLSAFPGVTLVSGTCGLSKLSKILWTDDDGSLYTGTMSYVEGILSVLNKLPYKLPLTTSSLWRTEEMDPGDDPLARTHFHADVFRTRTGDPVYCNIVLRQLMQRFLLTIRQGGTETDTHAWHVHQDFGKVSTPPRWSYGTDGSQTNYLSAWNPATAWVQKDVDWERPSASQRFLPGLKAAAVTFDFSPLPNLIVAGRFGTPEGNQGPAGVGRGAIDVDFNDRYNPYSRGHRNHSTTGRDPRGGRNPSSGGRFEPDDKLDSTGEVKPFEVWNFDGFSETERALQFGAGPNGEHCLRLGPAHPTVTQIIEGVKLYEQTIARTKRAWQKKYTIAEGTGKNLLFRGAFHVIPHPDFEESRRRYPVFVRIKAGEWYMQRDGQWSLIDTLIKVSGEDLYVGGWYEDRLLSAPLPEGSHEVEISLYAPVDVGTTYTWVNSKPLPTILGMWTTNLSLDLLLDGVEGVGSRIVNAVIEDTSNEEVRDDIVSVLGDAPLLEMVQSLLLDGEHLMKSWSIQGEADPAGNGKSLDELSAQELLRGQRLNIPLQDGLWHFEGGHPRIYRVIQYPDGSKWQFRSGEIDYGRATFSGQMHRIRRDGFASLVNVVEDPATGVVLGGGAGAATGLVLSLSDQIANSMVLGRIGVTGRTIPAGDVYQVHIRPIGEPVIAAGDRLGILNENNGQVFYFQSLTDQVEETRSLRIGDFDTGAQPATLDRPIPAGSTIFMTTERLLSIVAQTRRAFRVAQELDAVTTLAEDVDGFVFSLPVEPLAHDVKKGTGITIEKRNGDAPFHTRLWADAAQDATVIEIQNSYVKAAKGDYVKVSREQRSAELLVSPSQIKLGINREREGLALGSLTAEASGTLDELQISPIAKNVYVGDDLLLVHRDTGFVKKITVRADTFAGAEALPINSASFETGGPFPAGSDVRISAVYTSSQIDILDGQVSILTQASTDQGDAIGGLEIAVGDLEAGFNLHAGIFSANGLTAGTNITGTVTSQGATLSSHTTILSNNGLSAGTNITQSVSSNTALINSHTNVLNANGLSTGTNIVQMATDIGGRIVLSAQTVGNEISQLSTIILSTGATQESGITLSASLIRLAGTVQSGDGINSTGYVAGVSGWQISGDGNVEFNDGTFRGVLAAATGSFSGAVTATSGSFKSTASGGYWTEISGSTINLHGSGTPPFTASTEITESHVEVSSPGGSIEMTSLAITFNNTGVMTGTSVGLFYNGALVWTEDNDGPGSGLNADTLDGSHASAFAAASHTHPVGQLTGSSLVANHVVFWNGSAFVNGFPPAYPRKSQEETIAERWTFNKGITIGESFVISAALPVSFGAFATGGSTTAGFYGTFPVTKRTISGTTGTTSGNAAAINSIAQALAAVGLFTNSIV